MTRTTPLPNDPGGKLLTSLLFMFAQVATVLTLLATLVHSVLGCCWHHDHSEHCHTQSCVATGHHHASGESTLPCGACFGNEEEEQAGRAQQSLPCEEKRPGDDSDSCCDEAHCVYTTSNERQSLGEFSEFGIRLAPVNETLTDCLPGIAVSFAVEKAPPPFTAAEVRARLQVWLI